MIKNKHMFSKKNQRVLPSLKGLGFEEESSIGVLSTDNDPETYSAG
jgi:hypothetical protein